MLQQLQLNTQILKLNFIQRLDKALVKLFPDYSRTQIKKWILDNRVSVNNKIINKPNTKVFGSEQIIINISIDKNIYWKPQNIPLNIIYEDEDILIINKPHNLVVHPGAGNLYGTLLNAILYHYPDSINIPRAGIIHRLDKDTTGLMIIAKTIPAYTALVNDLRQKKIIREYEAVVNGSIITGGMVNMAVSRHATKRTRMAVNPKGKSAITHYRVLEHFRDHTRLRLRLESGRTHQIRVHMAHINHSLVGDPLYGIGIRYFKGVSEDFNKIINNFNRQALHAVMLQLYQPITGAEMKWQIDLPIDMAILINVLKKDVLMYKDELVNKVI